MNHRTRSFFGAFGVGFMLAWGPISGAFAAPNTPHEQAKGKAAGHFHRALAAELSRMAAHDQDLRRKYPSLPTDANTAYEAGYENGYTEAANTVRLKEIIRRYGWPSKRLVGSVGAADAWLLVQHADHDPAFQRSCLPLIQEAVRRGEVAPTDAAYLTDRVLTAQGKPQVYGTQFRKIIHGQVTFKPIANAAGVEGRRKAVGLLSLKDYEKQIVQAYGQDWPRKPH